MARSEEARKVLRELDAEPAASAERLGEGLTWSAAERANLDALAANIDRRFNLSRDYEASTDPKVRVRLSSELRLLENAAARLLQQINTDIPEPDSLVTVKARRAYRFEIPCELQPPRDGTMRYTLRDDRLIAGQ